MVKIKKNKDTSKEFIWGKRKNKKWIYIGSAAAVVIAIVAGFLLFSPDSDIGSLVNTIRPDNNQDLVRRSIDGVYVPDDQSNYFPVAVMIENFVLSRPPSGLSEANLVYEALVEGGITRFMAVYAGQMITVPEIGPVRSARPYYLDWTLGFGSLYAHVGGSPQSFQDIETYEVMNLNQFYNPQYFWRDNDREPPHNLYTSGEKLAFALRDLESDETGSYAPWTFKEDEPLSSRPSEEKSLEIDFSSQNYLVEYRYDRESNDYVRYQAGEEHRDKPLSEDVDGSLIRATNIIVQKVKTYLVDQERLGMDVVGEGPASLYRDGRVIEGRWEKTEKNERTKYFDENGDEVSFNAGPTWIEIVPTDRDVTYN